MAVLELHSKLKDKAREEIDAGYLTDVVRATALKSVPGLRVMTRENMTVLLEAAGKKLEDCEGECEVDTGRKLGADLVVTGEVLRFGTSYKLTLRLHETHDGQLLSGSQAAGATADELDRNTKAAVLELLAPLRAPPAPAAPPKTACKISLAEEGCPRHPETKGTFEDTFEGAERDPAACLRRAAQFHTYCGSTQIVTATYFVDGKAAQSKNTRRRCDLTLPTCPQLAWAKEGGTFAIVDGADEDPAVCVQRAALFATLCAGAHVTTRFVEDGKSIAEGDGDRRCQIALSSEGCPKHPETQRLFVDFYDVANHDAKQCLRRASQFRNWCGASQLITATFFDGGKPVASKDSNQRCEITLPAEGCPLQRENSGLQPWAKEGGAFADTEDGADSDRARCMRRASEYAAYCGSNQAVVARFFDGGLSVATQTADSRCEIELPPEGCPAHRDLAGTFNDTWQGAEADADRCMLRAAGYQDWCASTQPVAARFYQAGKMLKTTRTAP